MRARLCLVLAVYLCCLPASSTQAETARRPWQGQPVSEVLDFFQRQGMPLVYSTNLVTPGLRVISEPHSRESTELIDEILRPHGLGLAESDGIFLVVRIASGVAADPGGSILMIISNYDRIPAGDSLGIHSTPALTAADSLGPGLFHYQRLEPGQYAITITADGFDTVNRVVDLQAGQVRVVRVEMDRGIAELETLTVSASRYVLFSNSQFFIDQRAIQALPDLGEDPVRSVQRLPGSAASGLSSRSHFRGGEHNETAIYLNGLQLLDPFHIRNYHSIFSSIDARAISGVEAYTGGFPALYGDHMSGVLLLDTQKPEQPLRTELGLSVYNTSVLSSGFTSGGTFDWLVSARRSNLGLLLNKDLGEPDYFDVFAEAGFNFSDSTRLSFNALYADDQIVLVTERDPVELERSVSTTHSEHFWLLLENQWTPFLSSETVLSYSGFNNRHQAEMNDPDKTTGAVIDNRETDIFGFRQGWLYDGFAGHNLRWGLELRALQAKYEYASRATYSGFYDGYPGITDPFSSEIRAAPDGLAYALYLSDRWDVTPQTALQMGLRWDWQDYTEPVTGGQLSPRLSLLHSVNSAVDLRLTWGRYYQAQPINELQVEDGIDHFFRPQRAAHWIAGAQYRSPSGYRLRAEVFSKDYERLKPRFENLYDPLSLIPQLQPDRIRLDPESARAKGVELTLEYRGNEDLSWWATYTWSKATDRLHGDDELRSWDQRHAVQAGVAWQHGPWEMGVAVSVHSGWPATGMSLGMRPAGDEDEGEDQDGNDEDGEEYEYFPIPGPRNAEHYSPFATLDIRISREFPVKIGRFSAFFEVTNTTNRKNECCIDYDTEETEDGSVYLDGTIDYWLPIIPAIGVLWEF